MSYLVSLEEATDTLSEAGRSFYQKNWMLGTAGNLSIRLSIPGGPLCYVITASGCEKGALTPEDFVQVGGQDVLTAKKSSAETLLHEAIYRHLPETQAIYHVHTVAAAVLSRYALSPAGSLTFTGLEMLKGLGFETHDVEVTLPVLPNSQDMQALSQLLPNHLDPKVPGILLQGHGLYAWGNSPFEAKRHIEIWEYLFQYKLMEHTLLNRA